MAISPRTTYLVLPGPPDSLGRTRIVSRRAAVPLTLTDYRRAPDGWADAGIVAGGLLCHLDAPLTVQHALLAAEPIQTTMVVCLPDEAAP